jgi:hypothetical protein
VGERKGGKGLGRIGPEVYKEEGRRVFGCAERESTRARAQRWDDGWRGGLGKEGTRRRMGGGLG